MKASELKIQANSLLKQADEVQKRERIAGIAKESAMAVSELHSALVAEGFTPEEALGLVHKILDGGLKRG